jgi:hypothetical protein
MLQLLIMQLSPPETGDNFSLLGPNIPPERFVLKRPESVFSS